MTTFLLRRASTLAVPTARALVLLQAAAAWALLAGGLQAAEAVVVFEDDFERAASSNPPSAWAMWGAQQYKDPANFTRDTSRPHAGVACFRIHHPANTEGYVVSSPQTAVRPRAGKRYVATFWARSQQPGEAIFGWTAYGQVRPLVDAPSPGLFPIRVGRQWTAYRFVLDEGWDLFAEESPYLLLTFKATDAARREQTLWIDDVVVREEPSPRQGRLVNPKTLAYDRLAHRLAPGAELAVTVDAGKRLGEAAREVGGVSFHRVAGWPKLPYDRQGRYLLTADLEEAVRQMRLPMTRFYALGDEPFGLEAAIDRAAEFLDRVGIPRATTPLEFEIQGATSKLPPEVWARGVRHSAARGYPFCRWEIANEPYVGRAGRAFATADEYLEHFLAVSKAIRQVQPGAQIGMPINHQSPAWGNYLLKQAAGHYDFVVPHYYCYTSVTRNSFEQIVLAGNYQLLDEILQTGALIRGYNSERDVCQYDTEWGMQSSGAEGQQADFVRRNGNIFGMMHRAVRLIYYLREGALRGASSWEMFTYRNAPGFGFLAQDAPRLRSMTYWLYYYFNRHAGRWVVAIDGTAPYYEGSLEGKTQRGPLTPVVATLSDDQQSLFLILANGSWTRAVPCRIELKDFAAGRTVATVLSHADPDGYPLLEKKEDLVGDLPVALNGVRLTATLPPHAVVFITVQRAL